MERRQQAAGTLAEKKDRRGPWQTRMVTAFHKKMMHQIGIGSQKILPWRGVPSDRHCRAPAKRKVSAGCVRMNSFAVGFFLQKSVSPNWAY